jgi:hypothetical protein
MRTRLGRNEMAKHPTPMEMTFKMQFVELDADTISGTFVAKQKLLKPKKVKKTKK